MSILWLFHAEVRRGEGWEIPLTLPASAGSGSGIGGQFGWMKSHFLSSHLFFGEGALFPFSPGRPPGISELCQRWNARVPGWDSDGETAVHWIPYEQLCVDLWSDPGVLVCAGTPVRLASLFGDGSQAFPGAALRAAGATEHDLRWLLATATPLAEPIDRTRGAGRGEMERLHEEASVWVSWQTSIDELLPPSAEGFRELRRLAQPADLRVVAWRG